MANVRQCTAFLSLLVLSLGLSPQLVWAAEPLETPKLSEAARSGWLSFAVLSGRVTLTGSRFGSINSTSSTNGRTERLTIRATGIGPAVSYQMTGSPGEFSLEMSAGDQLAIQWKPGHDGAEPVRYWQQPGEPVGLEIGAAPQQQTYRAMSIWHLMIAEPETVRRQLVPLLRLFQFDLDPAATAEETERMLLAADAPVVAPDRQRWAALVEQLASESFASREAADRELREAGRMVITYLERLDAKRLDAEQQYRIRRIVESMSSNTGNDTAEQVAAWLAGDPSIWLSLLARDEESVRRLAAKRLAGLLGRELPFDPAAAPETRAAQLEQLRSQLETK